VQKKKNKIKCDVGDETYSFNVRVNTRNFDRVLVTGVHELKPTVKIDTESSRNNSETTESTNNQNKNKKRRRKEKREKKLPLPTKQTTKTSVLCLFACFLDVDKPLQEVRMKATATTTVEVRQVAGRFGCLSV